MECHRIDHKMKDIALMINPIRIIRHVASKIINNSNNNINNYHCCNNCESIIKFYNDILSDPVKIWLYQNREERMDASNDMFDESRRRFHLERYHFAAKFCNDKVVADIACGTGYGTELLSRTGNAKMVFGVDVSSEAINYANIRHSGKSNVFICSLGETTGLGDDSIDIIVSFETIEHVPNDLDLLKEFHRILKAGGILVCSTPNEWPIELATHHLREYSRDSFCGVLEKYFIIDGLYNQNSGGSSPFNHEQPFGIVETSDENYSLAECFIAVCKKE